MTPMMVGAAYGGWVNRRTTQGLADELRTDLRRGRPLTGGLAGKVVPGECSPPTAERGARLLAGAPAGRQLRRIRRRRRRGSLAGDAAVFALTAVVAASAAKKVTEVVWTASTGKSVPGEVDNPDEALSSAVAFAVLSGAAARVIRMLINRNTRKLLGV